MATIANNNLLSKIAAYIPPMSFVSSSARNDESFAKFFSCSAFLSSAYVFCIIHSNERSSAIVRALILDDHNDRDPDRDPDPDPDYGDDDDDDFCGA